MRSNTARKGRIKQKRPFPNKAVPISCHCEERSDAAILKPKVWHPAAKHGAPARRISNILEIKMEGFIAKPSIFVSLRGRGAAVAIFKPKVWHPVAKHGSGKRQNPRISNRRGATPPWCFSGSAISRGRKPAFHMRQYLSLGRKPNFTAQPYSLARRPNFTAQRWPCLVPGRRLVPSKIAASGIENTLLAMTKSVGFSEKRNSFQNDAARHRAKRPHTTKSVRFPNKTVPISCHCEEHSDVAILK